MSYGPEDPTILTCGECNQEVYRATKETYSKEALRKAVHDHQQRCPNRVEAAC